MTSKHEKSGVERSRLTLLLGLSAAAGSGACMTPGLQSSPDPIADSMKMRSPSRSRAPAAPAATTESNGDLARDPAGAANSGGGSGGSGGSY